MNEANTPSSSPARRPPWALIALIVVGAVLVAYFGMRTARSFAGLRGARPPLPPLPGRGGPPPRMTDVEAIRGWMTIPFIAKGFEVPEGYLFEQLHIPPQGNQKKSLADLNRVYAPGQRNAIPQAVQDAIRRYLAEHPPTPEAGGG